MGTDKREPKKMKNKRVVAATNSDKVKRALIEAQNTIRKKFRQLHNYRLNRTYRSNEEYKPIIEPLKKLVDETSIKKEKQEVEEALQKEIKKQEPGVDLPKPSTPRLFKRPFRVSAAKRRIRQDGGQSPSTGTEFYSQKDDDTGDDQRGAVGGMDISGVRAHEDTGDDDEDENGDFLANVSTTAMEKPALTPRMRLHLPKKAQLIKEIKEKEESNSPLLDTMYGFHTVNNELFLGNDSVRVKGYGPHLKYHVRGRDFPVTQGLTSLLMNNAPQNYNERDLKNYKEMLVYTSAHKEKYRPGGPVKRFPVGNKYNQIIKDLFPPRTRADTERNKQQQQRRTLSGEGMKKFGGCMQKRPQMNYKSVDKAGKFNYTYWDDPNELVDRLRILLASQSAGHTGHENEMISIVEELREAKIIK